MGLLFFKIKAKRSCPVLGKTRPGTAVYYDEQILLPHVQTGRKVVCPLYAKFSINTLMGPISLTKESIGLPSLSCAYYMHHAFYLASKLDLIGLLPQEQSGF